jgi:hypothetical protein
MQKQSEKYKKDYNIVAKLPEQIVFIQTKQRLTSLLFSTLFCSVIIVA